MIGIATLYAILTGVAGFGVGVNVGMQKTKETTYESYIHNGVFDGHNVTISQDERGIRHMVVSPKGKTRGHQPPSVHASDYDTILEEPTPGFGSENRTSIKFQKGRSLDGKVDKLKETLFEVRFSEPMELERVFAYIKADRK